MPLPPAISAAPPPRPAQDFAFLREAGMAEIRARAALTWTDHNHHDAGITILEAICYAYTELGLKLDQSLPDLIASGTGQAAPVLPPAHDVLPMAPVTSEDLRRQLLDHYLVRDAWINTGAADIASWYSDPAAVPPLGYNPNTGPRQRPAGLFDVLVAFEDIALNSNTYSADLIVGPDTVTVEYALPHWDEPEAAPLRQSGVTITGVAMLSPANPWRRLDTEQSWFGRATVNFTAPGGPAVLETWVVMRIATPNDLPALVLPAILTAAQAALETVAPGAIIEQFRARCRASDAAAGTVWRDLQTWRNLCQAPVRLAVSRIQDVAINARIEVAGATDLEERLAQIFFDIDISLSPPRRFETAAARLATGSDPGAIFDGPLLSHGILPPDPQNSLLRTDHIFVSDVLNIIMQPRGGPVSQANPSGRDVIAVTELSLANFISNRAITVGATDCLRLTDIARHRPRLSLAKSRVVFVRDNVQIPYDAARVAARFEALRATQAVGARLADFNPALPAPVGQALDIAEYTPFQHDLPAIYGVSPAGLPPSASSERHQQALQLRAYLMIIEQFLADTTAHLAAINRVFSPDADETDSYFVHPLYELADLDQLLRAFTGVNFDAFAADPDNAYVAALRSAAETEATALDRRNRMLDHLLARHGEEALGWSQELHRWGQQAALSGTPNPLTLPQVLRDRQVAVNRALLRSKSDFLADVPRLCALRLQAFGDPAHWLGDLVTVTPAVGGFDWTIQRGGVPVLESAAPSATLGEAQTRAREALRMSGRAAHYGAQDFGGANNRRFTLRNGPAAADPVIARGATGFGTLAAANAAAVPVREDLAALLLAQSRTAMERRIDHLTGVRLPIRRPLLTPLADIFEVFDTAAPPPFSKAWRLWSDPGLAGQTLLTGTGVFADPVEPAAETLALADIETTLRFALDAWNYQIAPVGAQFSLTLTDADGNALATAPLPFASQSVAEAARDAIIAHLFPRCSAEGFHMVETLLLRPAQAGEPFLNIPSDAGPLSDPYSNRLILIFPSGNARDFAVDPPLRTQARPHRFRDPAFRRHADWTVRQSCPAHLLPTIRWVDRATPGSVVTAASFDRFEEVYFDWLNTTVIAGATPAAAAAARAALIGSLNAILAE